MGDRFFESEEYAALTHRFLASQMRFAPKSFNSDKSRALCVVHVQARDVFERLDEVLGPQRWQSLIEPLNTESVRCGIGLRGQGGEWLWKWDVGERTDVAPDMGAASTGFKRAAVQWNVGDMRGFYAIEAMWLPWDGHKITEYPDWWHRLAKEDEANGAEPAAGPPPSGENGANGGREYDPEDLSQGEWACPDCVKEGREGGVLILRRRKLDKKPFYACTNWNADGNGCNFVADKAKWESAQDERQPPKEAVSDTSGPCTDVQWKAMQKLGGAINEYSAPPELPDRAKTTTKAAGEWIMEAQRILAACKESKP